MKIGLFVYKIHQFEPDTGQNTQDRCVPAVLKQPYARREWRETAEIQQKIFVLQQRQTI